MLLVCADRLQRLGRLHRGEATQLAVRMDAFRVPAPLPRLDAMAGWGRMQVTAGSPGLIRAALTSIASSVCQQSEVVVSADQLARHMS